MPIGLRALLLLLFGAASGALAFEGGSGLTVSLLDGAGKATAIGRIDLEPRGGGYDYSLTLDDDRFVDKFLSMRPFRCLEQSNAVLCYLDYPYAKGMHVTAADLRDLEYDLMFVQKTPEEYGIDAWNGRYFVLRFTAAGIEGILHEVDLNVLAAPPEDGVTHPVTADMLHPADPEAHPYPRLLIR